MCRMRLELRIDCQCAVQIPKYVPSSLSYFKTVWHKMYDDFKLRRHCRFAKCTLCTLLKDKKHSHKSSPAEKAEASALLDGHYLYVAKERLVEHRKKQRAKHDNDVLFLAMDGMAQYYQGIPQFAVHTKADAGDCM